jgi:hypothetical protein
MRPLSALAFTAVATLATVGAPNHKQSPRLSQGSGPRPQWGALEPGRYGVGFRLAAEYDHSRRVAPSVDFEGRRNPGPLAMALPMAVWYPAAPAQSSRPMEYGTFAALGARRTNLTPVTPADRVAAIDGMRTFAGFAFGRQIAEPVMRAVDTTVTAAVRDAAPAVGRFPVVLAATDGSVAAATVLFEYLASHGLVVMAVPSRLEYASLQVSQPNVVVEARVRDFEFLLDHARRYPFADTSRIAAFGVNFDGMAALAFQMKNMVARAIVSLDGWEGKANGTATVTTGLHYDPRRLRVPYLVVLQDEQTPPPSLRLDRTIFDAMRYSERQWLVLRSMSHAYLVGNPLVYPDVPADKRRAYELLVRGIHRFLASSLGDTTSEAGSFIAGGRGNDAPPDAVKDLVRVNARPAVPDDAELERLIMVDRGVDKVASILRDARRTDSTFTLFSQQTMALYAFRFARQNDLPFAIRLLELNAEAFPRSWSAADALGNGYRDAGDTTRALVAFTRALGLLAESASGDSSDSTSLGEQARARQAIEEKIAKLKPRYKTASVLTSRGQVAMVVPKARSTNSMNSRGFTGSTKHCAPYRLAMSRASRSVCEAENMSSRAPSSRAVAATSAHIEMPRAQSNSTSSAVVRRTAESIPSLSNRSATRRPDSSVRAPSNAAMKRSLATTSTVDCNIQPSASMWPNQESREASHRPVGCASPGQTALSPWAISH